MAKQLQGAWEEYEKDTAAKLTFLVSHRPHLMVVIIYNWK